MPRQPRIALTSTWRAPGLPGLTAPIPANGVGLQIPPRIARKMIKTLRTFDKVKEVKRLAPYAQNVQDVCDAVVNEMVTLYGAEVSASVCVLIETMGLMLMWSRFLSDEAAKPLECDDGKVDPKLVQLAMTTAEGSKANLLAAHTLHGQIVAASQAASAPADPLAGFLDAPADEQPSTLPAPPEPEEPDAPVP